MSTFSRKGWDDYDDSRFVVWMIILGSLGVAALLAYFQGSSNVYGYLNKGLGIGFILAGLYGIVRKKMGLGSWAFFRFLYVTGKDAIIMGFIFILIGLFIMFVPAS